MHYDLYRYLLSCNKNRTLFTRKLFVFLLARVVGELTAQLLLVDCQVKTLLVGCYNWRSTYRGRGADDLDIK